MSIFLERQKVRKRRAVAKRIRVVERILFSLTVILGGLAALYGIYLLVFTGPIFKVREVSVEGEFRHVSKQEVMDLAGIDVGNNLFGADVTASHDRLAEHPWIEHAAVRRRLPDTVWIYVEEYEPVAVVLLSGKAFYIDQLGHIFKEVGAFDPKGYNVISGIFNEDALSFAANVKSALNLLTSYKRSSVGQIWGIAELNYDKNVGFSIVTDKGPIEILLGHDAFEERLSLLERSQSVINRRGGNIRYILANDNKRITVGYGRPAGNSENKT